MNEVILAAFEDELEKIATVINPAFRATPSNLRRLKAKSQRFHNPSKPQKAGRTLVRKARRGLINTGYFRSVGTNRPPR